MKTKTGRYSGYIRPFSYLIDFIIINVLSAYLTDFISFSFWSSFLISVAWFVIAINLGFYEVYRYTKVITIINCSLKQGLLFTLFCLALAFFYSGDSNFDKTLCFSVVSLFIVLIIKLLVYFSLKKYRRLSGRNYRKVILIGDGKSIAPLQHFFTENPDYGYQLIKVFDKNLNLETILNFITNDGIDEIYCAMADLTNEQIGTIIDFCDNNLKTLKFIPDEKQVLSRNFKFEYYDYIPVIPLRNIPLDRALNYQAKRIFDILFSVFVIFGILSWMVPLVAVLIKLESKGPVFFKQSRPGLGEKEFFCYKFRSMEMNETTELKASKNDPRVTKTGKFIRKTSIDEMPQFFNVLFGEMAVVGPRPHLWSQNESYGNTIKKYMVRHYVKPGITGLAQSKGYRGEIETKVDMANRIKLDVFYIENWSLLLDIKIIFQTIINVLKGDAKAY
jgi:putative colanic acid biosysnthesis UDP-glucose lipid carrier transferase